MTGFDQMTLINSIILIISTHSLCFLSRGLHAFGCQPKRVKVQSDFIVTGARMEHDHGMHLGASARWRMAALFLPPRPSATKPGHAMQ